LGDFQTLVWPTIPKVAPLGKIISMRLFQSTLFLFFSFSVLCQNHTELLNAQSLDFWLGQWNLTWKNPDGSTTKAKNTILKTLDGKVFQENFEDDKGFKGTSISVFDKKINTWHQAWADNQGGYFNFVGAVENGNFVFKTLPTEREGKVIIQKMVFRDVKKEAFVWDWMGSQDGGQNWKLNWQIKYTKR
jgi:hypothetical protein